MKTYPVLAALLALPLLAVPALAQSSQFALCVGGRYHNESSALVDEGIAYPFEEGDFSASLGVELRDAKAYWQFLVDAGRDLGTGTNAVDSVYTPQLNLLFRDGVYEGGVGVLKTYLDTEGDASGWSDLYYQFLLGLQFSLTSRVSLSIDAIYPFADWGAIGDFDTGDLEYGARLAIVF